MEDIQEEKNDESVETEVIAFEEAVELDAEEGTSVTLSASKHFYCLQVKYKQGSKEDEVVINQVAKMSGDAMKEQTNCNHGMDAMVLENAFAIATAVASKNENFFAKALYCKYEKYPIGVMLGQYNPVLKVAISPTLYIQPKYRSEELIEKLQSTFKYWAINTKKADKAFLETLQVL